MSLREKFDQEQDDCECPRCEMIEDYTEFILEAEDEEEVAELVRDPFEIAEEFGMPRCCKFTLKVKLNFLKKWNDMGLF